MDNSEILSSLLSLIFVISIIGLCAFLLKRFVLEGNFSLAGKVAGKTKRLKIIEHMPIDAKRRMLLLEKDGKEEILIMLGATSETVISTKAIKK